MNTITIDNNTYIVLSDMLNRTISVCLKLL